MSVTMSTRGSASGATPKSKRSAVLDFIEGGSEFLILLWGSLEYAFWRIITPIIIIAATGFSVYFAKWFAERLFAGSDLAAMLSWAMAFMVISSRVFLIFIEKEKSNPREDRRHMKMLWSGFIIACALSIGTTFFALSDMYGAKADRSLETASLSQSAKRAADAAAKDRNAAEQAMHEAKDAIARAKADINAAIVEFETHKRKMARKWGEGTADYNWSISLSTKGAGGGGLPYQRKIDEARSALQERKVEYGDAELRAARKTAEVIKAEREFRLARTGASSRISTDDALRKQAAEAFWSGVLSIMCEIVSLGLIGPVRRAYADDRARYANASAMVERAQEGMRETRIAEVNDDALTAEEIAWQKRNIEQPHDVGVQPVEATLDPKHARAFREHGPAIEAMAAKVASGDLTALSYDAVRKAAGDQKFPNSAIDALRAMLVAEQKAVQQGNKVVLI